MQREPMGNVRVFLSFRTIILDDWFPTIVTKSAKDPGRLLLGDALVLIDSTIPYHHTLLSQRLFLPTT